MTNLAPSRGGVKLKKEDYFPLMSSSGQFLENGGAGADFSRNTGRRIRDAETE